MQINDMDCTVNTHTTSPDEHQFNESFITLLSREQDLKNSHEEKYDETT